MTTGSVYFNFSSEVLSRTSSNMQGRWYLPMFLLRDGLLTLMYKASLMVLMRFCFSPLLSVYKIMRSNIYFRPEEAMLETGKSLSTESKLVLF